MADEAAREELRTKVALLRLVELVRQVADDPEVAYKPRRTRVMAEQYKARRASKPQQPT